jgi:hypothetical protein
MVDLDGAGGKRKLVYSMLILAGLIGVSVVLTAIITAYFRAEDPINQCISDPAQQPFQVSVPISAFVDGVSLVVRDVGVDDDCIRPVHTLTDNVIHVGYEKPHEFTLGHFFYYWLGDDIRKYETRVYVNNELHRDDFLDIVLRQGDEIRVDLTTKNQ